MTTTKAKPAVFVRRFPDILTNRTDVQSFVAPAGRLDDLDIPPHALVEVNGLRVSDRSYQLRAGDRVDIVHLPGDPGTIAIGALIGIGLSAASAGLSVLMRPKAQAPVGVDDEDASPNRRFEGPQNTVGADVTKPLIFGEVRVAGHIAESSPEVDYDLEVGLPGGVISVPKSAERETQADPLRTRIIVGHGPLQSVSQIRIDDNPVENLDGVTVQTFLGEATQATPDGFEESATQSIVTPTVVRQGTPVVFQTGGAVDRIAGELRFASGLYTLDAAGRRTEREVEVEIEYRALSVGGWVSIGTHTIGGESASPRSWWFRVSSLTEDIYDVRVTRITADNTDPAIADEFRFESLVEIIAGQRAYPGLGGFAVRQVPQGQVSAPRLYTALVRGRNDLRIYSTPTSYQLGWSRNRAWCFLWWLTSKRHGLGRSYTHAQCDIASFIRWAQYLDSQADNGAGGTEVRSEFDMVIDRPLSRDEWIELFTRAGNARAVEEGGRWRIVVNEPRSPVLGFSEGSYLLNSCRHDFVSSAPRASRVTATITDRENDYLEQPLSHEDQETESEWSSAEVARGHVSMSVTLPGVSRRSEAKRQMDLALAENRYRRRQVSFRAGAAALPLRIGDIFAFASRTANVGRIGTGLLRQGRGDGRHLQLDREVVLEQGETYEIWVEHASGGYSVVRATSATIGEPTEWIYAGDWDPGTSPPTGWNPQPGDIWSIDQTASTRRLYECVDVSIDQNFRVDVVGLEYDERVYDRPITVTSPGTPRRVDANCFPELVTDLSLATRETQNSAGNTRIVIDAAWSPPTGDQCSVVGWYDISIRRPGGRYQSRGTTRGLSFIIGEVSAATAYEVAVVALSPTGRGVAVGRATSATITTP